jgi:hypothetical protein
VNTMHMLSWFTAVLFATAIISRLVNDKSVPGTVGGATSALANIFRGVFHG